MTMQELLSTLGEAWLPLLICAVTSYGMGSLNFAIILTKTILKKDIRDEGSGNAGATNMLRSHGKGMAALTTLGDLLKAVAAGLLARYVWLPLFGFGDCGLYGAYVAGVFCVIGHMYPIFFGFRGGKGVLTVLGMLLVVDWPVGLAALGVFIVVVALSRMVSLGSVLAGVSLCIMEFLKRKYLDGFDTASILFCTSMLVIVVALAIMKHAGNIKRILNGTENKLGSKK